MYAGEIVHIRWNGQCTGAMIVVPDHTGGMPDMQMFERGGVRQMVRVAHGGMSDDRCFHYLSECPDVSDNAIASLPEQAAEESPEVDEPLPDEDVDAGEADGTGEVSDGSGAGAGRLRGRSRSVAATANLG